MKDERCIVQKSQIPIVPLRELCITRMPYEEIALLPDCESLLRRAQ